MEAVYGVVGIATRYVLDVPGIDYQCCADFPVHVQNGPEAHLAPCAMATAFFLGVKRPESGADNSHPSSVGL